jgi:hypothetical protein
MNTETQPQLDQRYQLVESFFSCDVSNHLSVLRAFEYFSALPFTDAVHQAYHVAISQRTTVHYQFHRAHPGADIESDMLRITVQHYNGYVPSLVWLVTASKIRRLSCDYTGVKRKEWTRYYGVTAVNAWLVTHNDHPREPLHLRGGNIPTRADDFRRELIAQMDANDRLDHQVVINASKAINRWQIVSGHSTDTRVFTREEMQQLYAQCALLGSLHHLHHVQLLTELFGALDFLTLHNTPKLTEIFAKLQAHPSRHTTTEELKDEHL